MKNYIVIYNIHNKLMILAKNYLDKISEEDEVQCKDIIQGNDDLVLNLYSVEEMEELSEIKARNAIKVEIHEKKEIIIDKKEIPLEKLNLLNIYLNSCSEVNSITVMNYLRKTYLFSLFNELEKYLTNCFKFIISTNPSIIQDQMIQFRKIQEHQGNIKTIRSELIDKRIHDSFYKNFWKILDFSKKILNINHNFSRNDRLIRNLDYFKQIRNIFIHSDGKVNYLFLSRVKKENLKIGDEILLTKKLLIEIENTIYSFIKQFDESIIDQFPELIFDIRKKDFSKIKELIEAIDDLDLTRIVIMADSIEKSYDKKKEITDNS